MAMRIGVGQAARATDEYLAFASQLGVSSSAAGPPGERRWEVGDLIALRKSRGLRAASRGHRKRPQCLLRGRHARTARAGRGH